MDIDEIVKRVQQEAEQHNFVEKPAEIKSIPEQVDNQFISKDHYHVNELLILDEDVMVDTLYRCILKRESDPAASTFKQQILAGILSPLDLIDSIRYSSEGCEKNISVKGLRTRLFLEQLKRIPLIGRLLRVIVALIRLPNFIKQLDQLSVTQRAVCRALEQKADIHALEHKADKIALEQKADKIALEQKADKIALEQKADKIALEQKADKIALEQKADKIALEQKAARNELDAYRESIRYVEYYFHCANQDLQKLVQQLTSSQPSDLEHSSCAKQQLQQLAAGEYDKLYLDFEYLFRGTPQMVTQLLTAYQPLLNVSKSESETAPLAVDLGCGRGEMVHYLGQQGYDAIGVDLNRLAVQSCHEHHINAKQGNALDYLSELDEESISVVSTLHLVEHLSNDELFQLLKRSLQVLKPGGMLLIETPNPRNLFVGSGDFYRDFTHDKPLFPDTLKFLLNYFGFSQTAIFYFEQPTDSSRRLCSADDISFDDLSDYLQISRDYAVVGYKPCA
ncbi:MAG: methyltransferase domain-containing protein [Deltaproteobacteria bacterium]|nr:methyltransferase domain-containing protein [Deltaproteobacteria bacterium]